MGSCGELKSSRAGAGGKWMSGQCRRGRFDGGNSLSVQRAQPAVLAPNHFLNRRFAAERAAAAIAQRPADEIDHVGFAVLRFDEIGVAGALQLGVGPMARAQDVSVGMQFVGAGEISRARHCHGVVPIRAAFRGEQVIPAVAFVEMRRFGEAERRAFENVHRVRR